MTPDARLDRLPPWLLAAFGSFALAFLLFFALGLAAPESPTLLWGWEDGPVEYLGALFWAAACAVCAQRLLRGQAPRALLAFWAAFAFVAMGEEVSWFQRVLGIETPEPMRALNGQGEINLHNLEPIDFGPVFNIQQAFHVGFCAYFLLLPFLVPLSARARALADRFGYVAPSRGFLALAWGAVFWSYAMQKLGDPAAYRVIAEGRETVFAFIVLAYAILYVGASAVAAPRPALAALPEAAPSK